MSDSRVEIIGWDQFVRVSGRMEGVCSDAASEAATATAAEVVTTVRGSVPVVSGRLKSGVVSHPTDGGAEVVFGEGVPYAGWIEYGGTRGRPYVAGGRYFGPAREAADDHYLSAAVRITDDKIGALPWPK